jgi:hypothetical protein
MRLGCLRFSSCGGFFADHISSKNYILSRLANLKIRIKYKICAENINAAPKIKKENRSERRHCG